MTEIFEGYGEIRAATDTALKRAFDALDAPAALVEGMRYAVEAGGKRLRPCILVAFGRAYGASDRDLLPLACGIELLHTASLVHDDLPALDNDVLRRGKPTNHAAFGEANAILHGDALVNFAHTLLLSHDGGPDFRAAAAALSRLAGAEGMLGGQYLDVNADPDLDAIQLRKTAAMFEAAFSVGAIAAHASEPTVWRLTEAGRTFGLLFQVADDLLDAGVGGGDIGKTRGKDVRDGKRTRVTVYGVREAERELRRLADALGAYGDLAVAEQLGALVSFVCASVTEREEQ